MSITKDDIFKWLHLWLYDSDQRVFLLWLSLSLNLRYGKAKITVNDYCTGGTRAGDNSNAILWWTSFHVWFPRWVAVIYNALMNKINLRQGKIPNIWKKVKCALNYTDTFKYSDTSCHANKMFKSIYLFLCGYNLNLASNKDF